MAGDWSSLEVAVTVADYLDMLERELRGQAYNKKEHNRRLQALLNGRSAGAIEFKHQNISAVMIELGFPYIEGYKPRGNYQELLRDEVVARLGTNPEIAVATEAIVEAPAQDASVETGAEIFVDPPTRDTPRAVYEWSGGLANATVRINYLEREARNRSLGLAGERLVLEVEYRRLWASGAKALAERVEHVSVTRGDGLGYDILSFEPDGRERVIEVKTTAFGLMTPFFASVREVSSSDVLPNYQLYRVFKFRDQPKIFTLSGPLRQSCVLDPVQFRASVL